MKYIKKFENVDKDLYVCNIADNDLEYYYDKIKELNLEYRYFKLYGDRNLIYVYVTPEQRKNNFLGWHLIEKQDTIANRGVESDLDEYMKEIKAKKEAEKYNL
jgi:hypothetical protein